MKCIVSRNLQLSENVADKGRQRLTVHDGDDQQPDVKSVGREGTKITVDLMHVQPI